MEAATQNHKVDTYSGAFKISEIANSHQKDFNLISDRSKIWKY